MWHATKAHTGWQQLVRFSFKFLKISNDFPKGTTSSWRWTVLRSPITRPSSTGTTRPRTSMLLSISMKSPKRCPTLSKLQLRQAGRPDHFEGGDLHEGVRERQLARFGGWTRRSEGREHHRSCRWRQRMRAHGSSRQCVSRYLSSAIILKETIKLWSS